MAELNGITRQGARADMRSVGITPANSLRVLPTHSKKLYSVAPFTSKSLLIVAEHD